MKKFVGAFGIFLADQMTPELEAEWISLEDLARDKDWWIGIYSLFNLLRWAKVNSVLTLEEIGTWLVRAGFPADLELI